MNIKFFDWDYLHITALMKETYFNNILNYLSSHKANCRAGAFNAEGSLVATGSVDTSIKILDVDRMLAKSQIESMASGNKTIDPGKGTIQPGLRLLPSGNFFLALNRSHHFLLKKVRI